jgi:tRNA nucleotidyltransferase/poly(A) polymerase
MNLRFRPDISKLLDFIQSCLEEGVEIYIVGGGVRDVLLGRGLKDLDFAMRDDPTSLAKRVAHGLEEGFFVLDDERHTARVVHETTGEETFSLDFVRFTGGDLAADLQNRDFTINAMAISIRNRSKIIDPLNGRNDLEANRLEVCQPKSLLDDPVRVLRGVRLAMEFGFSYAAGVDKLMREAASHLPNTSYERQRDELFKILEGSHPAKGMKQLHQFKVFETLIPHLVEQEAVPALPSHDLSLWEHTLKVVEDYERILKTFIAVEKRDDRKIWWMPSVLKALSPFAGEIRTYFSQEVTPGRSKLGLALLGALLHDISKPMTIKAYEEGGLHYYHHDAVGADLAWETAKRLKLSNAESEWLKIMVRHHMYLLPLINCEGYPDHRSIYRFFNHTGEVGVAIAILSLADTTATYGEELSEEKWEKTVQVARAILSAWWRERETVVSPEPLLDGNDLQRIFDLKPGEKIGCLLDALREAQASGEVRTEKEAIRFINRRLPPVVKEEESDEG